MIMLTLLTSLPRRPSQRRVRIAHIFHTKALFFYTVSLLYFVLIIYSHFIGKYTALIAVLVVGSFIIPMAQYFWYVKDDDSSDKFFNKVPEPEPEPPKKKGWF
jgi:hypothetical protein